MHRRPSYQVRVWLYDFELGQWNSGSRDGTPCTHAWQISHHLSEDGNVCFSFELTFLSSDVTKLPGSGFFLNVSGGRDENGTKVHVWKANLKCPDSQWRIHLV